MLCAAAKKINRGFYRFCNLKLHKRANELKIWPPKGQSASHYCVHGSTFWRTPNRAQKRPLLWREHRHTIKMVTKMVVVSSTVTRYVKSVGFRRIRSSIQKIYILYVANRFSSICKYAELADYILPSRVYVDEQIDDGLSRTDGHD